MSISRISLVVIPFIILSMGALFYSADLNASITYNFTSSNVTVNGKQGNISTSPINLPNLLGISLLIGVALAICIVMSIQVLGSGISGSVIPIVFTITVLSSAFVLLSGLSFDMFMAIPLGIGYCLYFFLVLFYLVGVTGLVSTGGGD